MSETAVLTDARGRRLTFHVLDALEQLHISKALAAAAMNFIVGHMAKCAAMVAATDGLPMTAPINEKQIEVARCDRGRSYSRTAAGGRSGAPPRHDRSRSSGWVVLSSKSSR
ncbi:hypothetical protein [Paracraurococcus ruber]|uniref:Uncharacterized protein n=1 Tax=Paracraurococcus ruber TaxID=77675 RepID=A0ABS1D4N8_9PROT|nr:hypothetical protein [Paracraurococcus ruber]MBK1661516.1 hypothetical protein [Paracraurococcus ruber]TDG19768.1 hypothetical protein E2C05_27425 [Paracraurococcus ruber]